MSETKHFSLTNTEKGVQRFLQTSGAYLIDVRTEEEYKEGHIPQSMNIPLAEIDSYDFPFEDADTPLFVYCHSGNRSSMAVAKLHDLGYDCVENIGGIVSWHGQVER